MSSNPEVAVDLTAIGQALAADIRGNSSATGYFGTLLDDLAATFEKALQGNAHLSYEHGMVRGRHGAA